MAVTSFNSISMTAVSSHTPMPGGNWLWDGYLAPGNITLLTSQWKTGKTTLLTGLLRGLERGEAFLDRTLVAGKALVVSEESTEHWAERLSRMPIGPHVELLARPFPGRPSFEEWTALIDHARRCAPTAGSTSSSSIRWRSFCPAHGK